MKCSFNCNLHNTCCNSVHWKFNIMFGGGKPQWSVLKHNGPMFPPKYIYLKIPIIINNKEIILSEQAEEYAFMYAKYIDTPYTENNTFKKNFWKDFKPSLSKDLNINSLDDIDFTLIKNYIT